MAAYIISAIDNINMRQLGEKGHIEYGWSENIREKILQFSFQLVRNKNETDLYNLKNILRGILFSL